jgi:hypothetical protein
MVPGCAVRNPGYALRRIPEVHGVRGIRAMRVVGAIANTVNRVRPA